MTASRSIAWNLVQKNRRGMAGRAQVGLIADLYGIVVD